MVSGVLQMLSLKVLTVEKERKPRTSFCAQNYPGVLSRRYGKIGILTHGYGV